MECKYVGSFIQSLLIVGIDNFKKLLNKKLTTVVEINKLINI